MSGPRIAVIGAGAAGLSTALHAAMLGARSVVVLDKGYPASGSSGLSAGIFNRQTPNLRELELRVDGVAFLGRLERERGLPLERNGYIRAGRSAADLARFGDAVEAQQDLGVTDSRVIDRDELTSLVPGIDADGLVGGLYCPSDGHFDGHLLCGAYVEWAESLGVRLRLRCEVLGATHRPGRGVTLTTSSGEVEADVVVNAAGAWAPAVANLLGTSAAVRPQRHAICVVHLSAPLTPAMPTVNEYVPGSGDYALYWRPESSSRLIAGLHTHAELEDKPREDPDAYARGVEFDYLEAVAERLDARLPGLEGMRLEPGWAGLYPISPDGVFQVGPHSDVPWVVDAGGLGGVGLTVSPAVGRIAAEWAVNGESTAFRFVDDMLPGRPSLVGCDA